MSPKILQTKVVSLLIIFIILSILSILPLPWNESVENVLVDLQFNIRGDRQLESDIAIVFIGAEDVKSLNEWPITRDYYGYLTHVLHTLGAKVIGIDVLFDRTDLHYPEYDTLLARFFQSANHVCLPIAFSELTDDRNKGSTSFPDLLIGLVPAVPVEPFKNQVSGLGFSNLGKATNMRKVPVVSVRRDRLIPSFGCELARLYLGYSMELEIQNHTLIFADSAGSKYCYPLEKSGKIRLNHFGDIENLTAISLVDLFQSFDRTPDSLNFKDKLVIVAVTAPGIANLESTPLSRSLPATLIHATVAENLIHQNFLRDFSLPVHWLLIALLILFGWFIWCSKRIRVIIGGSIVVPLVYWIIAVVVFRHLNYIVPLFYPTLTFFITIAFLGYLRSRQRKLQETSIKALLEKQVVLKEKQLKGAKAKLTELQNQLKQKTTVSEQTEQLAEERQSAILKLEKELRDLQTYMVDKTESPQAEFAEIVHSKDSKMAYILELVSKVSADDIAVLIMGETGTGKEMVARAIHQTSQRKDSPFVAINCGALPETLLDSELFGHEKGSFTGAHSRRRGRFELADGGTIFLDEITETTQAFQARLLRVLQEGTFERLGGEQTIKVNVRVIAATNKNLLQEMENNRFRSDLFYRLNGFPITLPPLRERQEDIPLLAVHFLKKYDYQTVPAFSSRAMEILQTYHWQGNVRELENVVRRAAILAQSEGRDIIREDDLPEELLIKKVNTTYKPLETQILESLRILKFSHSAISQTAKVLGDRDRGTITEYFRGICFEHVVKSEYNIQAAAKAIAATHDEQIIEKVQSKIDEYINNLSLTAEDKIDTTFKGLPKKYHPFLHQVIQHLQQNKDFD